MPSFRTLLGLVLLSGALVLADHAQLQERDIDPTRTIYIPPRSRLIIHATLSSLGFLIFLPIGVLIARYRTTNPFWFRMHQIIQAFAGILIIVGVVHGMNYANDAWDGGIQDQDNHNSIGQALFALYFVQLVIGFLIHLIKPPRFPWSNPFLSNYNSPSPPHPLLLRPPQNYLHALLGLVIIFLSFYQVWTGYKKMWPLWDGYHAPDGVNIVWHLWLAIFCVVYFAGFALLRRQWNREKEDWGRKRENGIEMKAGVGE